jgi:hypothetical protein
MLLPPGVLPIHLQYSASSGYNRSATVAGGASGAWRPRLAFPSARGTTGAWRPRLRVSLPRGELLGLRAGVPTPRGHPATRGKGPAPALCTPAPGLRPWTPYFMWEAGASNAGACPISCEYRASAAHGRYDPFAGKRAPLPPGALWARHAPQAPKTTTSAFAGWGLGRDVVPAPAGTGVPASSPGVSRAQSHLEGARGRVLRPKGTRRLARSPGGTICIIPPRAC